MGGGQVPPSPYIRPRAVVTDATMIFTNKQKPQKVMNLHIFYADLLTHVHKSQRGTNQGRGPRGEGYAQEAKKSFFDH